MLQRLLRYVSDFLAGRSTRTDLERWLLANLQALIESGDQNVVALANEIDADLIALNERLIDTTTFVERLQAYLSREDTHELRLPGTERIPTSPVSSGVASETIRRQVEVPGPTVDLRLPVLHFQ